MSDLEKLTKFLGPMLQQELANLAHAIGTGHSRSNCGDENRSSKARQSDSSNHPSYVYFNGVNLAVKAHTDLSSSKDLPSPSINPDFHRQIGTMHQEFSRADTVVSAIRTVTVIFVKIVALIE